MNGIEFILSIKKDLTKNYFNKEEKKYILGGIVGGGIVGGALSVLIGKEIFDLFTEKDNLSWIYSSIGNLGVFLVYPYLSPITWGAYTGNLFGGISVYKSKIKKKISEKNK